MRTNDLTIHWPVHGQKNAIEGTMRCGSRLRRVGATGNNFVFNLPVRGNGNGVEGVACGVGPIGWAGFMSDEPKPTTRNDIVIALLTEIRDELRKLNRRNEPPKPKPRHVPPPPSPVDDPGPKRRLQFNEAINMWEWKNEK